MLPQAQMSERLAAEFRANHDRVASLVRPLDPERLLRRPDAKQWSVGEVLEHLTLMDELFLSAVMPLCWTKPRAWTGTPYDSGRRCCRGSRSS